MILQQDMSYHKHWFLDSENSLVFQSWWAFYQECFLSFLKMVIWKREISIKPIAQSLIHETQDRIRLIWIVHIPSGYSGAVFTPKLSSWCHLLFLLTICLKKYIYIISQCLSFMKWKTLLHVFWRQATISLPSLCGCYFTCQFCIASFLSSNGCGAAQRLLFPWPVGWIVLLALKGRDLSIWHSHLYAGNSKIRRQASLHVWHVRSSSNVRKVNLYSLRLSACLNDSSLWIFR